MLSEDEPTKREGFVIGLALAKGFPLDSILLGLVGERPVFCNAVG